MYKFKSKKGNKLKRNKLKRNKLKVNKLIKIIHTNLKAKKEIN